jgi:hypothetical protein
VVEHEHVDQRGKADVAGMARMFALEPLRPRPVVRVRIERLADEALRHARDLVNRCRRHAPSLLFRERVIGARPGEPEATDALEHVHVRVTPPPFALAE